MLSAPDQSDRERSRAAVAILCPACCRGRSLQEPERRLGDPADLSSGGASDRSAHLHRVPGLLLVHHPTSSPLCLGAGAHGAKRPGKVRGCSHDRRPCADTDGRELVLTRYTQPEPELHLLIQRLKLHLPPQPPPRIA